MNCKNIHDILADTCYTRTGGSQEEKCCAEYLQSLCRERGLDTKIEAFPVAMYHTKAAVLLIDGKEVPCRGYYGAANGRVRERLYYLRGTDDISLKRCKGKIVLMDGMLKYDTYDKLVENGAKGIITYNGNICFGDKDIDQREIRFEIKDENRIPCINIHISDAVEMVKKESKFAEIILEQTGYTGESYNVTLDIEGEIDEAVVISAHYDSTALSRGAYDNMSGCIALLWMAEYFSAGANHRRIRLLWCGSEERGLLGSMEYCRMHEAELKNTVLNINLDMLGAAMGEFAAFSCVNEEMADFMKKFMSKHHFPASVRYAIRSSDSNSFIHYAVPAVSFARYAPSGAGAIHTRYDLPEMISAKQLLKDIKIITLFTEQFVKDATLPVSTIISEKIQKDVEDYMQRKIYVSKQS